MKCKNLSKELARAARKSLFEGGGGSQSHPFPSNGLHVDGEKSPPPTQMYKGAVCAFPFSRERGYFLAVCLGKIFPEKTGKSGVFKPISRDIGSFPKASREIKKKGV